MDKSARSWLPVVVEFTRPTAEARLVSPASFRAWTRPEM